jgi:hypothetical protein
VLKYVRELRLRLEGKKRRSQSGRGGIGGRRRREDVLEIESEEESDEDSGEHNVPESEHGEVVGREALLEQVLREDDWKEKERTLSLGP